MTSTPPSSNILGAVLAGGAGRRFGGDKAMALLAGEPLIAHAARAVGTWSANVVICGRDLAGYRSVADRPVAGLGPLGAINAALCLAAEQEMEGVLTIACDMPLLPAEVATELLAGGARYAAGQQLLGYWPASLAPVLDRYLATENDRSVRAWARHVGAIGVEAAGLPNINAPADLIDLARRWPMAD